MIVQKGEYYTIPIKASYKNKIDGTIIDESNKRTTVFIEPTVISKLNEHYQLLKAEEISEEYQVLAALTGCYRRKRRSDRFIDRNDHGVRYHLCSGKI